jgi:hypothetical protein
MISHRKKHEPNETNEEIIVGYFEGAANLTLEVHSL